MGVDSDCIMGYRVYSTSGISVAVPWPGTIRHCSSGVSVVKKRKKVWRTTSLMTCILWHLKELLVCGTAKGTQVREEKI